MEETSDAESASDAESVWLHGARHADLPQMQDLLTRSKNGQLKFDINCKGKVKGNLGWSALHLSSYFGNTSIVDFLLQSGCDVNSQNDQGDTPLHRAAFTGRLDVVTLLLKWNADVCVINGEGLTAKQLAKTADIGSLIEAAENYETKKAEEDLLRSAREGDLETLISILKSKNPPNINCCDTLGNNALHSAAYRDQKEAAILLLQNGISTTAKNAKGQTPLDMAYSPRMRLVLDITPLKVLQKEANHFEGMLLKRTRLLGWRPVWVLLERGVLSLFKTRADAAASVKRKGYKYLDDAKIECVHDSSSAFIVKFSDGAIITFSVETDASSQLNRQKWVSVLSDHIEYSTHFIHQGDKSSDDGSEDVLPLGSMQDVLQNAQVHQQLLEQQVSTVTSSISCLGEDQSNRTLEDVSVLHIRHQLSQIVETTKEMSMSLSHCLTILTQQDQVRRHQVAQQEEQTRVLQDALRVLAQEHHQLTQCLGQRPRAADMYDTDEDEFHDCVEPDPGSSPPRSSFRVESPGLSQYPGVRCAANGAVAHSSKWGARAQLPAPMFSRNDFSVWSILKQCIGKELSKITMPVIFNEPLSFVQRVVEYMEYADLLKLASSCEDPIQRLEYVTAFAVSATASNWERIGKPFNPLLGETYELSREDLGFKIVCEQVSHHPPVSAFHASSPLYTFHGAIHPKLKFWGKSVEVTPKGLVTLHLLRHNEIYTWQNVNCCVHNIIVGKLWIEHYGSMEVVNHSSGHKALLSFKPCGWFGKDLHKVEGHIIDKQKRKLRSFYGKWIEALYSYEPDVYEHYQKTVGKEKEREKTKDMPVIPLPLPTSSKDSDDLPPVRGSSCDLKLPGQRLLWYAYPRTAESLKYYSFTLFAMMLNEMDEELRPRLPPTDCRLRPDIRLMEEGNIEAAAAEKNRLEEKQRGARKERKKTKDEWRPRWFKPGNNPHTGKDDWLFTNDYWNHTWERCQEIF